MIVSKVIINILVMVLHHRDLFHHLKFFRPSWEIGWHLHPHFSQLLVIYFDFYCELFEVLNKPIAVPSEALNTMHEEFVNIKEQVSLHLFYWGWLGGKHDLESLSFVMDKLFRQAAKLFWWQFPLMRIVAAVDFLLFFLESLLGFGVLSF